MTIAFTRNDDVPNYNAFSVSGTGKVLYFKEALTNPIPLHEAEPYTNWRGSSTGTVVISRELLGDMPWTPEEGPLSLYRDILGFALGQGVLSAYDNNHNFFWDVGTADAWNKVQSDPQVVQSHLQ